MNKKILKSLDLWNDPTTKWEISTPAGPMTCWYEDHDEGYDRGAALHFAQINGVVYVEDPFEGWRPLERDEEDYKQSNLALRL